MIFLREELLFPGLAVGAGLTEGGPVVGQLMGLDTGEEFAAVPDVEQTLAEQGPERALLGGINVGRWNQVGAQQVAEFFGINAVVLVFAAVNGLEVKGVGEHEVDVRVLASVGLPREIT